MRRTDPTEPETFEIPEGALPVLMQVGNSPVTCAGWIAANEDLPDLLESLAKEFREINESRENASTPGD